jgi:hypothetical protein
MYMALSPPVGPLAVRVTTVTGTTVLMTGLAVVGSEVSRSTAAIVITDAHDRLAILRHIVRRGGVDPTC